MTVYVPKGGVTYRYDFWWRGHRYTDTTHQVRKEDAQLVESQMKLRLRQEAAGIAAFDRLRTPRFQDWAEIYYEAAAKRLTRADSVDDLIRVVLRFWGAKPPPKPDHPKSKVVAGEPYHDLRLADPILEPAWIERFEEWMQNRGIAGQTRNHYRSVLHQFYKLALTPRWRKQTNIAVNPFDGVPRDRGGRRTVTVTVEELQAWLTVASYHVRLAVAIAALAPKLRLGNILALRWTEHLDARLTQITVARHKTARYTGTPLAVPIVDQLRLILEDARRRTRSDAVVSYRGRPVTSIRAGVREAAVRAGLTYGRVGGVTFHTLRHSMATLLAELSEVDGQPPLAEPTRQKVMGHASLQTTQHYTHIRDRSERAALERLSRAVPIVDLVTQPWRRAKNPPKPLTANFGGRTN